MRTSATTIALMMLALAAPLRLVLPIGTTVAWADQTFNVTPFGSSAYVIGGSNNPELTLERGETVTFNINALGHPFYIKTVRTTGSGNAYNDGVTGQGTSVGTLTFVVPESAPNTLFYQCSTHSPMGGTLNIVDPVGVPGSVPNTVWLGPASPNPVRQGTRLRFAIPREAAVNFKVLDLQGRVVRELLNARRSAGIHSIVWDGLDDRGRVVANGLYLIQLRVEGHSLRGKLVMLR